MIETLLGLVIFILGFGLGLAVPLIIHKYFLIINSKEVNQEIPENAPDLSKDKFTNLTSNLITEWQTGEVVGGDDSE